MKYNDGWDDDRIERAQEKRERKAALKEKRLKWTRLGINASVDRRSMRVTWIEAPIP